MNTIIPTEKIKVKVAGRFRAGRILALGRRRETKERMVKVRVDYNEIPWSSPFRQIEWYPITALRKQDQDLLIPQQ